MGRYTNFLIISPISQRSQHKHSREGKMITEEVERDRERERERERERDDRI
jgi:hypothetical protein